MNEIFNKCKSLDVFRAVNLTKEFLLVMSCTHSVFFKVCIRGICVFYFFFTFVLNRNGLARMPTREYSTISAIIFSLNVKDPKHFGTLVHLSQSKSLSEAQWV